MRHAVIMAGGAGKRLWPLSRLSRPKQLLPLLGGQSLMTLTVERLAGVFDDDKILIVTNAEYVDAVAESLPGLPRENIIGEPVGRDTANAIALGAEILAGRDPDATMAVFTADHVIRPAEKFLEAVGLACEAAEQNPEALVTFGVRPTWPHTGLGYIHAGETIRPSVHEVRAFREKPDHPTARRYVESGEYFWNSGMFVWTLGAIRGALQTHLPDTMSKLAGVSGAVREGRDLAGLLAEAYPGLSGISIDYAVMEKAARVLMVELNCEWLDVGSWPALEAACDLDDAGNVVVAENAALMDSYRNVVVTEDGHLLAVLGVDDCIIVHSEDATLVCNKSDSQRLKELVAMIERGFGRNYV